MREANAGLPSDDAALREVERACRESYGRLIAYLASGSRDLSAAEDALSDAFASALATWPKQGVPSNPDAWLLTAARRKLIDQSRRAATRSAAEDELIAFAQRAQSVGSEDALFPDERLKLMFVCAHPAIDPAIPSPLMLQTVLGLNATTISAAFLVAPKTMGQRLSRAKLKIRDAGIAFKIPSETDLPQRLSSVHEAIYAAFGLAWELVGNSDSKVANLSEEAIWLARITNQLLPDQPETMGLLALMLHSHARRAARRTSGGEYVPLEEQDPGLWSETLIIEAEDALANAAKFQQIGPYQLEAAIQSVHATRRLSCETNWPAIVELYEALIRIAPTVGAKIGCAAAMTRASNAIGGLKLLESIDTKAVETHQPFWAVRAHLLAESGDFTQARKAYVRAIGLSADDAQRRFLSKRLQEIETA